MQEAIDTYLGSFRSLCPKVTEEELEFLEKGLTVCELKPRHFYIHAQTIQHHVGFVYRGLLRSFYVDGHGREITVNFVREGRYATHYTAFITRTPSMYHFQCMEPTLIVNLPYEHIQEGYDRFPGIERYGRLIAEEVLKLQQRRIEGFLFGTAEQRYLEFIAEDADLFNRVSLTHLSSYLGIERQTLTRIRQKMARSGF